MTGPLRGLKVIEIGGIGPGPFAGMMLADHGAQVIRIDRPGVTPLDAGAIMRSRLTMEFDLTIPDDIEAVRDLCRGADAIIEGFRPGVMERLGLGPDVLLSDNPRLVYGRITGWGQDGPYSAYSGHDINYIALSGALHAIGPEGGPPVAPLNLVGDYGGGAMVFSFGLLAAILHARESGKGQVVDAAMTEGAALLMTTFYDRFSKGNWQDTRGANLLDGGAPFYTAYETSDAKHIAFGSIEPQFYERLLATLGLEGNPLFERQRDQSLWQEQKKCIATIISGRTQAEWCEIFEPADLCFAPVLSLADAPAHPHNVARSAFVEVDGIVQPSPAPRYSLTPLNHPVPAKPIRNLP